MKMSPLSTLKIVGLLWLSATVVVKSSTTPSPTTTTPKPTTTPPPTTTTPKPTTTPPVPPQYQPTWESLESRPLPTWYDQEKIGIFIHWGVFSTIGLGEWFWYNWKVYQQPDKIKYMKDNFKPNFTYQDFGCDFTAELFNATEWSLLLKNSGARYVVLTSKHHEGYTLWPSKYSFSWNSVDVGPHKDLVGELAASLRKHTDIRFGLYHSLYEWFNRLYLDDKSNNFTTRRFPEMKTMPELYELVESYSPEIIWSDGEWEANDEYWQSKKFLAWLYNESPVKNTVVVNDRWGSNTLCKHGGFLTCQDRYNPKDKQSRKWENAMTIDKKSWGFRKDANLEDFLTSKELIQLLIETVSAGGNLLVNVAPTGYGKIPPIFEERLSDMGKWLSVNGKAIYGSRPWKVCLNDTVNPNVWYTEGVNSEIYALFSNWPTTGVVILKCLKTLSNSAVIEFIGLGTDLNWILVNDAIEIVLPNKALVTSNWAWTLKVINGTGTER